MVWPTRLAVSVPGWLQTIEFYFHWSLQSQRHRVSFAKLGCSFILQFQVNQGACVTIDAFFKYIRVVSEDLVDL